MPFDARRELNFRTFELSIRVILRRRSPETLSKDCLRGQPVKTTTVFNDIKKKQIKCLCTPNEFVLFTRGELSTVGTLGRRPGRCLEDADRQGIDQKLSSGG